MQTEMQRDIVRVQTHRHLQHILLTVKEYKSHPEESKSGLIIRHTHTKHTHETQRNSSGFQWSRNTIIPLTVHYKWAANCLWSIT